MTFLDTDILVGALLEKHPEHPHCLVALEQCADCFTDAHALAEMFALRKRATQIVTRNPSHFAHIAPDLEILTP
jgi:predicted nucleic acid-binding protein